MDQCAPSRPVPVMHFHGTADTLVAYEGTAGGFLSVADSTAGWVERNGCVDAAPEITFENGATRCETWSECDAGVRVTLCTSEGEGHCWPGTQFCPFGAFTTDLHASDEMWKFFREYSLP